MVGDGPGTQNEKRPISNGGVKPRAPWSTSGPTNRTNTMPTACFYNFSEFDFTGRWGGEDQMFPAKSKTFMPAFLAQHFAKHLTNRELHRMGLDHATSPKVPEDVPEFNKLFRQAYIRERTIPGQKRNTLKDLIDSVNLNMNPAEIAGVKPEAIKSNLGPDVDAPIAPREADEKEDPNYDPEKSGETEAKGPVSTRLNGPQIVEVPDDGEEDDGYEDPGVLTAPAPTEPAA